MSQLDNGNSCRLLLLLLLLLSWCRFGSLSPRLSHIGCCCLSALKRPTATFFADNAVIKIQLQLKVRTQNGQRQTKWSAKPKGTQRPLRAHCENLSHRQHFVSLPPSRMLPVATFNGPSNWVCVSLHSQIIHLFAHFRRGLISLQFSAFVACRWLPNLRYMSCFRIINIC